MSNETRQPKGLPTGGQFAATSHTEAEIELTSQGRHRPVMATVHLQEWQNDNAIEIGEVSFDAAPILAGMSAEQRAGMEDGDYPSDDLFHEAVARGLVPAHDGPFSVDIRDAMNEALEEDPDIFDKARGATQPRHADAVLDTPLTAYEIGARADEHNVVSGLSAMNLGDLVDDDLESHLDRIGNDLVGSELLMEPSATPVSVNSDGSIICRLEGDASEIIDSFDEDQLAEFEAGQAAAAKEGDQ